MYTHDKQQQLIKKKINDDNNIKKKNSIAFKTTSVQFILFQFRIQIKKNFFLELSTLNSINFIFNKIISGKLINKNNKSRKIK